MTLDSILQIANVPELSAGCFWLCMKPLMQYFGVRHAKAGFVLVALLAGAGFIREKSRLLRMLRLKSRQPANYV